jgi:ABC-2 type transport system permease protein
LRNTWALTKIRLRLAMRNKMFLFFSLVMPLGFLFFFVALFGRGRPAWVGYILGSILTMTVMGSFWGLSVQLVTFREQGILRRFRLAPLGAGPMLTSSILANYIMLVPTVVIEMVVCRFAFHLTNLGNLWQIFWLITFGSWAFSSLGLIVASVTNTMQETQIINQLLWTGFLFLSGATVPLAVFPNWLQRCALFIPATYLATGLEFAATNLASRREIIIDVISLLLGLCVAFSVSHQIFRWEPEAKVAGRAKLWVLAALVPFLLFGTYESIKGERLVRVHQDFDILNGRASAPRGPASDR